MTDMSHDKPPGATSSPADDERELAPLIDKARASMLPISTELALNEALPGLSLNEPTALLIDINNFFQRAARHRLAIDYGKLREIFENRCDLRYVAGYTAVDVDDPSAVTWVEMMREREGFDMLTKPLKMYTDRDTGEFRHKGNMDVELTIGAMKLSDQFGHVIIGTCDGDYIPLIEELSATKYKKVSILGFKEPKSWHGIDSNLVELAKKKGYFYNILDFAGHIHHMRKP